MKQYICIVIACLITSNTQTESQFARYDILKKGTAYQGMSEIAIAATLEDTDAITHFLYSASLDDLIDARGILESRLDILKGNLHQKLPRATPSHYEEQVSHENTHHKIDLLKNSIRQLSDKIETMKQYDQQKKEPGF